MGKRGADEEQQLTRDNVDDVADDDDDIIIAPKMADEETLSKRVIKKARRPLGKRAPASGGASGFGGPVAGAASSLWGSVFSGGGSSGGGSTSTLPSGVNPFASTSSAPTLGSSTASLSATLSETSSKATEFRNLNKQFAQYITESLRDNPASNWSSGLQDYLKYAKELDSKAPTTTPAAASSTFAAPVTAAKLPPPSTAAAMSAIQFPTASVASTSAGGATLLPGGEGGSGPSGAGEKDVSEIRAGEEDEETVHDVRAKLFAFKPKKEGEEPAHLVKGVGVLRLNKNKSSGAARLVMRADATGKVVLNATLFKGMKVSQEASSLKFSHLDTDEQEKPIPDKFIPYTLRVKTENDAQTLKEKIEGQILRLP